MAANHFLVVSGDPKWLQTSFWLFQATRNGCKLLFGRFGRKDAIPNLLHIFSKDGLRGGEGRRFIANRSSLGIAASPAGRVGAYRIRPFRRLAGPNTDTGVCPFRDICGAYAIRPYVLHVFIPCAHRTTTLYSLPSTLYPLPSKIHHPNALSDIHVPCTFIVCSITSRAMPSPPASGEM